MNTYLVRSPGSGKGIEKGEFFEALLNRKISVCGLALLKIDFGERVFAYSRNKRSRTRKFIFIGCSIHQGNVVFFYYPFFKILIQDRVCKLVQRKQKNAGGVSI